MSKSPSNPKGTRDFLPHILSKRNYILDIIKNNFKLFGFSEIETPALEKNSTLLGKYGNEGDRLVFKILNSGDKIKKANLKAHSENNYSDFVDSVSNKGLRYDLTVPLARFVAQHQNDLVFPFKRFQIQNVWRADRPQHGRFQEFTQCDADVIGTNSILQEIELIKLYDLPNLFIALTKMDTLEVSISELSAIFDIKQKIQFFSGLKIVEGGLDFAKVSVMESFLTNLSGQEGW